MAHTLTLVLLILLWKVLIIGSKEANVTCMVHDDCLLPCSFRPTGTVVIHWYKQQIPVHSYYYHKDQFGLQNKHFSGRTCLFNSHIPQGNASLLLRRVKVQDKGRYKCYTSTRKGNQELFMTLDVKAPIQSVVLELSDETVTCSSHNIYPVPQVRWATDPPSAREALQNSTIRTTDHKGLFTVESTLRILGNLSDRTYFCSFISADKSQVWTASRRNQESRTQEEGHTLSIPCVAPHTLHNFSLVWTFTSSADPRVILRYDSRSGHTLNQWEGQAELDQDRLPLGDGSLLLQSPDSEEHSGTYTCTFSGLQSRHVVQTEVNITVASFSVDEQSVRRSWWSTLASAAFVLFSIVVALPHCVRQRAMASSSHRFNGMGLIEVGPHKDQSPAASHQIRHQPVGCSGQLQRQSEDEVVVDTADVLAADVSGDSETQQEETQAGAHVKGNNAETRSS